MKCTVILAVIAGAVGVLALNFGYVIGLAMAGGVPCV